MPISGFPLVRALPWLEKIASFLKIPLKVFSLKEIFKQKVVDYFISEYTLGTNP